MSILDLRPRLKTAERSAPQALSFMDWMGMISSFSFQNQQYTLPGATQEDIGSSFSGIAQGAFKGSGVVFACIANRVDLFSEARFMFQRTRQGRPGDLFAITDPANALTGELGILDSPWEGGTTGDLLARMLQYVDIAGNAYVVRRQGKLTPLRPDWVSIIGGVQGVEDASVWHPDAEVLGYQYQEGGHSLGKDPVFFLPEQVAHFAPRPDPEARFVGMSWLTPVLRQIMADKAMDDHKLAFFENGATPNLVVTLKTDTLEQFKDYVKDFDGNHAGALNAYKTMWLTAGSDATVVGSDLRQLDFKITQGAGETRIAAAAGVPPVVVGLSEGLEAATYSNYSQARRRFADQTMRPLWRNVCGSLSQIIRTPSDARLWYDDRDIKALQEDQKDAAAIMQTDSASVQILVNSGFTAESSVAAVAARDVTLLDHTGLLSVQLQDPTAAPPEPEPAPTVPPRSAEDMSMDLLERELQNMLAQREPVNVNVQVEAAPTPDVNVTVEPAQVHMDAPHITVEPTRIDAGAVQVSVAAAPVPDVNVTVEPSPPAEVNVTLDRSGKRRVEYDDGRGATVVEADATVVKFDDGREATITETFE